LRESEERFRIIADQSPVMMWTSDPQAGCEFANRRWLDFTGTTLEQNLGQGWSTPMHRDDVQRTYDFYLRHFHARLPVEMEYRARRYDGEYRWIQVNGMPRIGANGEFTGYIGSAFDITDRRQHEAALQRSEALYRDVVESQIAFVCRFLPDATLTFANSAYCQFLGRPRGELLGGNFFELLPSTARVAARDAVTQAAKGGAALHGNAKSFRPMAGPAGRAGCAMSSAPRLMTRAKSRLLATTSPIANVPRRPAGSWPTPHVSRWWVN
jgi:PAS domain S-box-containing protein